MYFLQDNNKNNQLNFKLVGQKSAADTHTIRPVWWHGRLHRPPKFLLSIEICPKFILFLSIDFLVLLRGMEEERIMYFLVSYSVVSQACSLRK
jgi:hypothetical protein